MHDGTSKEGSGRVGLFMATQPKPVVHAYTVECNFHQVRVQTIRHARTHSVGKSQSCMVYNAEQGRERAPLPRITSTTGKKDSERPVSPARSGTSLGGRYKPEDWAEVGRGCLFGLLDYHSINPWSRLPNTEYLHSKLR